jgi:hypothetical protein
VPTFHVVVRQAGPEFDRSRPLEEQSRWDEHARFMEALVDDGFIQLGGPLGDGRVVHVVHARSEEEVRGRLAADPWSGSHLLVEAVEPWEIRLDARRAD